MQWLQCDQPCLPSPSQWSAWPDTGRGGCRVASGGQLKQAGAKKSAEAPLPKESGEEKAAQIRVLIAEDNMINMKVAMGILRRMGYCQVCAGFTQTPLM